MTKKIKPQPVVFTTDQTEVGKILDDLIDSLNKSDNLKLQAPKLKNDEKKR